MKKICLLLFVLMICSTAWGQVEQITVDLIVKKFKAFEYQQVIALSEPLLNNSEALSHSQLLELYRMKAVAHYSLDQGNPAKEAFIEILKIEPDFDLDPVINPPKIIAFFNEVKKNYINEQPIIPIEKPGYPLPDSTIQDSDRKIFRAALLRSALLPGWGHLHLEQPLKGSILGSAALITLPPAIYFMFDSFAKEKDYLNETDKSKIETKYDSYNKSYKLRNIFIASYTLIWLYTQYDLFTGNSIKYQKKSAASLYPVYSPDNTISLNMTITF